MNTVLKLDNAHGQTSHVSTGSLGPGAHQIAVKKSERYLLTDREGAIIAFIGSGRSNKEIARELGIAPETIKTHLKRIFQKLSASTRAQAVVRAQTMGFGF